MIRGVESNVVADQAFVVYQDKMVKALKAIARGAHDMVSIIQLFLVMMKNISALLKKITEHHFSCDKMFENYILSKKAIQIPFIKFPIPLNRNNKCMKYME